MMRIGITDGVAIVRDLLAQTLSCAVYDAPALLLPRYLQVRSFVFLKEVVVHLKRFPEWTSRVDASGMTRSY